MQGSLVNCAEIACAPSRATVKSPPAWRWIESFAQPKFAMSMSLTVFSFAMLGRLSGFEDRAHRAWERTTKYYENVRVALEVQARLKEWADEQDRICNLNQPKECVPCK